MSQVCGSAVAVGGGNTDDRWVAHGGGCEVSERVVVRTLALSSAGAEPRASLVRR